MEFKKNMHETNPDKIEELRECAIMVCYQLIDHKIERMCYLDFEAFENITRYLFKLLHSANKPTGSF